MGICDRFQDEKLVIYYRYSDIVHATQKEMLKSLTNVWTHI